jgi:quercetin dioxygenase-like cupin family protein
VSVTAVTGICKHQGEAEGMKEEATQPMTDGHVYVRDVRQQAKVPENGILSQTLHGDERSKVILFGFAAGQELSAHTAPYPATLLFLKGEATLKLGAAEQEATVGTFVYMPAYLEHGIKARNEVVMLLTMIKGVAPVGPALSPSAA